MKRNIKRQPADKTETLMEQKICAHYKKCLENKTTLKVNTANICKGRSDKPEPSHNAANLTRRCQNGSRQREVN